MKEVLYFYMSGCPYCMRADRFIAELKAEDPSLADVSIRMIEERQNKELADSYNYYYVPCFWIDGKKLHEGAPTKDKLRFVLSQAATQESGWDRARA